MNWLIIAGVIAGLNQLSGLIKNILDMYFKVKEEMQKSRTHQDDDSE
ncbi:TPA: hypothetical protein QCR55_005588 [Bacillus cereus]|nr:hypothetical protein [Bacillus cereus]HDR4869089.1 hypothetical protein [Bacillus cereus]HDR4869091.1 hypothetical protein [Bacillus cereus]HDR4880607.1 hypothetical protein [Bacillus cereus]HDR4880609.1 hypothetical protein [Bacillus cereus]